MKKLIAEILCVTVLFVLIFTLLTTVAFAERVDDYSKPGALNKTSLDSADILELLIGKEACSAEREYLELYGEYKIEYGSHIPTSFVSIGGDVESGEISVIAHKYEYIAQNGAEVTFLPISVSLDGVNVDFSPLDLDRFIAELTVLSDAEKVSVIYEAEFEISEALANSLLNKAYLDAEVWKNRLKEKKEEYEKAIAIYNENLELYEEYLVALAEYRSARQLYEEYLFEKKAYDKKLLRYNAYLRECEIYESDMQKYLDYEKELKEYGEKYAAYQQYLKDKEKHPEMLSKYAQYLEKIETVRTQLAIIDGTKVESTPLKRSVYYAVLGNVVTEVIANKDAIANNAVGVAPETVDAAGLATENLRKLYKGYFVLTEEASKYSYYLLNYEAFRSNFTTLFQTLDKMYGNSKVRLALKEKGIQEKYEILLAQLYYVVNAINDSPVKNYDGTSVYTSSYVVNSVTKATPLSILGGSPYMQDYQKATPLTTGYPEKVEEPILIEIAEPVKPTPVTEPVAPDTVEHPGDAPSEVLHPGDVPRVVLNPGDPPEPYVAPDVIEDLILAYEAGELGSSPRESVVGSKKIKTSLTVEKRLGNVENFKVEFRSESGELLCTAYADMGSYAEYFGALPEKAEDESAVYKFAGWVNADGEAVDVTDIRSDLVLYPSFSKELKSYTVSWNIDGKLTTEILLYGEMPVCPVTPTKEDNEVFEYIFSGWDKKIVRVTEDVTYTARFKAERLYTSQDGSSVVISRTEDGFFIDCSDTYDTVFDLSKIIPRAKNYGSITIVSRSCKLIVSEESVSAMEQIGAVKLSVGTSLVFDGSGYSITFRAYDKDGNELSSDEIKIEAVIPLGLPDASNVKFFYLADGERRSVRAFCDGGELSASFVAGVTYYAVTEYKINLLTDSKIPIRVTQIAKIGEFVSVELFDIPKGVTVESVYYIDANDVKHIIDGNGFYMPLGGASVGIDYRVDVYTVTFIADGKPVYTITANYGDVVTPPPAPEKIADGDYSYVFADWLPKIAIVTGDAVYEARYMKAELPEEETPDGLQITPALLNTVMKVGFFAFYGLLVFLPVLFLIIGRAVSVSLRKRNYD